jgi:hypothetical protein
MNGCVLILITLLLYAQNTSAQLLLPHSLQTSFRRYALAHFFTLAVYVSCSMKTGTVQTANKVGQV